MVEKTARPYDEWLTAYEPPENLNETLQKLAEIQTRPTKSDRLFLPSGRGEKSGAEKMVAPHQLVGAVTPTKRRLLEEAQTPPEKVARLGQLAAAQLRSNKAARMPREDDLAMQPLDPDHSPSGGPSSSPSTRRAGAPDFSLSDAQVQEYKGKNRVPKASFWKVYFADIAKYRDTIITNRQAGLRDAGTKKSSTANENILRRGMMRACSTAYGFGPPNAKVYQTYAYKAPKAASARSASGTVPEHALSAEQQRLHDYFRRKALQAIKAAEKKEIQRLARAERHAGSGSDDSYQEDPKAEVEEVEDEDEFEELEPDPELAELDL